MRSMFVSCSLVLLGAAAAGSAAAAPLFGGDELERNGAISRHLWTPDLARHEIAGLRVSTGLALGLRGAIRDNLGRNVTPAIAIELRSGSTVALLPAGERGAMLVFQTAP